MKAWTLIAFYLLKDIWSRWREHPSAALARLLVGVLLSTLLLLAQAGFVVAGRSLDLRVARLGAGTLLITEAVAPDQAGRASLGELLSPLATRAEVLDFQQLPVGARDPLGGECLVFTYGSATLASLAPQLAEAPGAAIHYLNARLPAGSAVEVDIDGTARPASAVTPPAWLGRLPVLNPVVLLPEELADAWNAQGHLELCLVLADPTKPEEIRALADAIRALLVAERRDTAHVQSPELLLDEVARLDATRRRTQALSGLAGGAVLALVFGAVASLEYRENRYVVALLRSFGAPSPLVIVRYAVEALVLLGVAGLLARALATGLHQPVFRLAGFENGLLDPSFVDAYTWDLVWLQLRWLVAGAALSVVPVALAVRSPVGRTLQ